MLYLRLALVHLLYIEYSICSIVHCLFVLIAPKHATATRAFVKAQYDIAHRFQLRNSQRAQSTSTQLSNTCQDTICTSFYSYHTQM